MESLHSKEINLTVSSDEDTDYLFASSKILCSSSSKWGLFHPAIDLTVFRKKAINMLKGLVLE
jgi:hypothetical protein